MARAYLTGAKLTNRRSNITLKLQLLTTGDGYTSGPVDCPLDLDKIFIKTNRTINVDLKG